LNIGGIFGESGFSWLLKRREEKLYLHNGRNEFMKKQIFALFLPVFLCAFMAGCRGDEALPEVVVSAEAAVSDEKTSDVIDLDLTLLSTTLAQAEASNILTYPANYEGKTIKLNGLYATEYNDKLNKYYHYIIYTDQSCCVYPIEFKLNGEHTYPDDYPKPGTWISLTGVYGVYDELGKSYYYLSGDEIITLD